MATIEEMEFQLWKNSNNFSITVNLWIRYCFYKPFQGKQGHYCCFAQFSEVSKKSCRLIAQFRNSLLFQPTVSMRSVDFTWKSWTERKLWQSEELLKTTWGGLRIKIHFKTAARHKPIPGIDIYIKISWKKCAICKINTGLLQFMQCL